MQNHKSDSITYVRGVYSNLPQVIIGLVELNVNPIRI